MTRSRLPIGIQTFRTIREEGFYYVDKTAHVRRLVAEAFFAGIPHDWHRKNEIAREGCCASVFYSHFAALGLDVTVEDSSSHGRVDMAVRFNGQVYLFEFKVVERRRARGRSGCRTPGPAALQSVPAA